MISILQKATEDGANDFMVIPVGGRTGPGFHGPVKMVTDLGNVVTSRRHDVKDGQDG